MYTPNPYVCISRTYLAHTQQNGEVYDPSRADKGTMEPYVTLYMQSVSDGPGSSSYRRPEPPDLREATAAQITIWFLFFFFGPPPFSMLPQLTMYLSAQGE